VLEPYTIIGILSGDSAAVESALHQIFVITLKYTVSSTEALPVVE
jgi:hypothetical protein